MPWSTRELAELTGTTVNTIRHYHRLGLLAEPERRSNGYKQYGIRHLVGLLRVRRLAELGVGLTQIGRTDMAGDHARDSLRNLDAELAGRIERLEKARSDIAAILTDDAPADAPAGFTAVASRLSEADSAIIHIYSRLYDADALEDVRAMVDADTDAVSARLEGLPPDADEAARAGLAEQLAPIVARNLIDFPWLRAPESRLSQPGHVTRRTLVEAMLELYNPAQLDVLSRAGILADERVRALDQPVENAD
ncbi:MerR family transcriptional regulator [Tomitella fengzijianii]|uniref:MerR family transcriptional regulator n=1 Tax=Tomitella fengzijianii TaxID=2597660 RepID=A0A516X100_9ACTN|nr:MerR family transcriptional regulator [Tomitella fengzijianii]QDQ96766.1 MerR family transcriptional regulator [Tomitella fengzijianii]